MADANRVAHVAVINEVFETEANKRSWVRYVDAWTVTGDADGNYAQVLIDDEGNELRAREDDGLHFTPEGGARLGRHILAEVFGP